MNEPFLAEITLFAGTFAPRGWAFCNGQLLSISQNTALFSLLGTTYGGDGRTTFALPDLRGRVPVHPGAGPGLTTLEPGEQGGAESTTLTHNQMPAHSHRAVAAQGAKTSDDPAGSLPSSEGAYASTPGTSVMHDQFIQPSGGSQPIENRQPFLGVNYIIALQGIFPARD